MYTYIFMPFYDLLAAESPPYFLSFILWLLKRTKTAWYYHFCTCFYEEDIYKMNISEHKHQLGAEYFF